MEEEMREKSEVRVKRKTLKAVLKECQRALEALNDNDDDDYDYDSDDANDNENDDGDANDNDGGGKLVGEGENCSNFPSSSPGSDPLADELCGLIKSRVSGPEFLEKLGCLQPNGSAEDGNTWDMVNDNDLWEGGRAQADQEDYVVVGQEDIVDGIACFMAAYLLSQKQTKDLTPKQLQNALNKTFSLKKRKGKLRKAFDGTKIIYNVASWSATAIGIYQNPALLRVASTAFWSSCRVISRLF